MKSKQQQGSSGGPHSGAGQGLVTIPLLLLLFLLVLPLLLLVLLVPLLVMVFLLLLVLLLVLVPLLAVPAIRVRLHPLIPFQPSDDSVVGALRLQARGACCFAELCAMPFVEQKGCK